MKNSGLLVETKYGKQGRTFNNKGIVNGKVPVYLATKFTEFKDDPELKIAIEFEETAILCDPATLKQIGFID